ncbi:hypothetical protein EVAR_61607_1 [Eumeta japonica]|uniref:Uncharacterized protein n=1 Tax=Eumeta variegata TaxID=151549 RepID=A0A4C1SGR0_EUMVA|nr:hypothetical protein EVAR_61607_1 [Eumeta japonica]
MLLTFTLADRDIDNHPDTGRAFNSDRALDSDSNHFLSPSQTAGTKLTGRLVANAEYHLYMRSTVEERACNLEIPPL